MPTKVLDIHMVLCLEGQSPHYVPPLADTGCRKTIVATQIKLQFDDNVHNSLCYQFPLCRSALEPKKRSLYLTPTEALVAT